MTFGEAAPWPTHSESDCTIEMQKHQHYNTVKWNVQSLSLITFWSHLQIYPLSSLKFCVKYKICFIS